MVPFRQRRLFSDQGNPHLRQALVEAARSASHTQSYLGAQHRHLAKRLKGKKATVAVAHSILTIVYHILAENTVFHDLGPDYFTTRDRDAITRQAVRRLETLGYQVTLGPVSAA